MWNKSLNINVKNVATTSKRICDIEINNKKGLKCLIISVYMPVNDNSAASILTFGDTLAEISSIINTYDEHNVIMGGDFNVDFNKESINKDLLSNFCATEIFTSEFHQYPNAVNFTYESPTGNRSYIDHFLYSKELSNKISNVQRLLDGHNLSDHHPLVINFNFNPDKITDSTNYPSADNHVRFNWNKISQEYKELYTRILDEMLLNLDINDEALNCNNIKCKIHYNYIH